MAMVKELLSREPFWKEKVLKIPSARTCVTGIVLKELVVPAKELLKNLCQKYHFLSNSCGNKQQDKTVVREIPYLE